jgi:hypothetical protein
MRLRTFPRSDSASVELAYHSSLKQRLRLLPTVPERVVVMQEKEPHGGKVDVVVVIELASATCPLHHRRSTCPPM